MTYYQPFPVPHAPLVPERRSSTADVIITSILISLHAGGFMLIAFFSMFWVMAADSCGVNTCNTDNLTYAYVLTDLVGAAVLMATMVVAIVLMARRRMAFWVPIAGMLTQAVLLAVSIGLLDNISA